jgi:hypothetical protein
MSTGNPGSLPKRSISSKMPGCSHVHFLPTSEAAPTAALSLPSSQGRSEGRAVRPEWCLRCTMRRRSRSPTTHMRVRSLSHVQDCRRRVTARLSYHRDHNWRRRPLVDLRRDQRRRPGRSEKTAPVVSGSAKPRAHYARNKLLGLLPLIISVVWRRESRRRSRSSGTRRWGLPSARRTIGCGRSGPTWAGIPSRQSPATEQGAETILGPAPGAGGSESRPLPG